MMSDRSKLHEGFQMPLSVVSHFKTVLISHSAKKLLNKQQAVAASSFCMMNVGR